ncbi:MAG: cupredoxin domain-containing protein [Rickettsiaceae bacterium]
MRSFFIFIFYALISTSYNALAVETLEVDLYIKDHKFLPEILKLPIDTKIRLNVHNQDDTIEEFESIDLKREKIVLAHSKTVIVLAPLKLGEYKFFGDFHPDTAQGKIVVVEEQDKVTEEEQDV